MHESLLLPGKKPETKETTTTITPITRTPEETRTITRVRRAKMLDEDWGFSRGIDYMPKTQRVLVHEGESIVPAGKNGGGNGSIIIENVTIKVDQIADVGSVEKIGAVLGATGQANILDKFGKSKYRMM